MKKQIIVLLSAVMFLVGCQKKEEAKMSIPPTPAQLAQAEKADIREYISTMGTIASQSSVSIVPQVSGQIVSLNFKQGQNVRKGDVLAVIDKRPFAAALLEAKGNLRQAQAQLKIDELSVERNRKLAKDGYVDKQTFDALVAKVEVDKGLVEIAKAGVETARINLDWCDVKAPVDGKVGMFNTDAGNVVAAGTSVITTIENVDKLFVDFVVPSQRLHEILNVMKSGGGKIDVEVSYIEDGMAQRKAKAVVDVVLNKIRYESGTAVLRGRLENAGHLFWPNQPVNVRVDLQKLDGYVLVPDICVQMNALGFYVYEATPVSGGVYAMAIKQVEKGALYGGLRAVKGIAVGAKVAERVSQLRLQAGPFVYAATQDGAIIGEDGKPILDKAKMFEFMKNATAVADKMRAEYFAKAAKQASVAGARNIKAEVEQASAEAAKAQSGANASK